jgi:dienelactone hydrolase
MRRLGYGAHAMRIGLVFGLLALPVCSDAAAISSISLATNLNETVVQLPVSVSLADGSQAHGEMLLTTYQPPGPGPFPIAIISHGRNPDHNTPERFRLIGMASYLVRHGFAVFVPTRLGYGGSTLAPSVRTEAPIDPEASGDCRHMDYTLALRPAMEQITATLNFARRLNYVDASRYLLVGQSTGGFTTVAYAASRPASGLIGYVNFAGGVGGDPLKHPGVPCRADRLATAYAQYGKTTSVPSLWIYTENDQYFAPRFSRAWYRAFAAGRSPSQFILQPAFSTDGHKLFGEGLLVWRPMMDAFLARLGIPDAPPPFTPTASGYAAVRDVARVPWLNADAKAHGYAKFLAASTPRAFALSEAGYWGWAAGQEDSGSEALANCNRRSPKPCVLYAVDDAVVWRAPPELGQSMPLNSDKPH